MNSIAFKVNFMTSTKVDVVSNSKNVVYIDFRTLRNFIRDVFIGLSVKRDAANIVADVLITSDLRGIDSHGIQRCITIELKKVSIIQTQR